MMILIITNKYDYYLQVFQLIARYLPGVSQPSSERQLALNIVDTRLHNIVQVRSYIA